MNQVNERWQRSRRHVQKLTAIGIVAAGALWAVSYFVFRGVAAAASLKHLDGDRSNNRPVNLSSAALLPRPH